MGVSIYLKNLSILEIQSRNSYIPRPPLKLGISAFNLKLYPSRSSNLWPYPPRWRSPRRLHPFAVINWFNLKLFFFVSWHIFKVNFLPLEWNTPIRRVTMRHIDSWSSVIIVVPVHIGTEASNWLFITSNRSSMWPINLRQDCSNYPCMRCSNCCNTSFPRFGVPVHRSSSWESPLLLFAIRLWCHLTQRKAFKDNLGYINSNCKANI